MISIRASGINCRSLDLFLPGRPISSKTQSTVNATDPPTMLMPFHDSFTRRRSPFQSMGSSVSVATTLLHLLVPAPIHVHMSTIVNQGRRATYCAALYISPSSLLLWCDNQLLYFIVLSQSWGPVTGEKPILFTTIA